MSARTALLSLRCLGAHIHETANLPLAASARERASPRDRVNLY